MSLDIINAIFEVCSGMFMLFSCRKLYEHKDVKGISMPAQLFFCAWGAWNMFYYPSLDQPASFYGACFLTAMNVVWLSLAFYYIRKNKNKLLPLISTTV